MRRNKIRPTGLLHFLFHQQHQVVPAGCYPCGALGARHIHNTGVTATSQVNITRALCTQAHGRADARQVSSLQQLAF